MARKPKYRRHSTRDLGFVEHVGRRIYFTGPYRSQESVAEYCSFLRANGFSTIRPEPGSAPRQIVVGVLADRFLAWAADIYPDGVSSENSNLRASVKLLVEYGAARLLVSEFTPLKLKAFQVWLARKQLSRGYINSTCARIRRMFKWGVSEELVPASVYHALATVPGLRKGRSLAVETKPRQPVAAEHVLAILPELSRTVQAMVMLQWLTGARSQSICLARPEQFDVSTDPWEWRPRHKTEHHDQELFLFIGPKAQMILAPLLKGRKPKDFLFQPKHLNGKRARGYRSFYDSTSYLRAISRAIQRANRHRKDDEKIPNWTPHQMRHSRGTDVRETYGLEAAQAFLGHARMDATQIYARRQRESAKRVAIETG